MKLLKEKKGVVLITILVFSFISILILSGLVGWTLVLHRSAIASQYKELSFHIAESGADYYRWHLAHNQTDYQDGTGHAGPYLHEYKDKDGNLIGYFSLDITPPESGSTIVTIKSTGYTVARPELKRIIQIQMAIPSLAKYATVANDSMRFGSGTIVHGPIYSNGGIRFDGLAYNLISSAKETYDDPDHSGGNEFGVHTHVWPTDPLPPATVPQRADVFMAGRQFPVPQLDFNGISADLSQIKTNAQSGGAYYASSGAQGYHIVLKTNQTYDLYKITSLVSKPLFCDNPTWSINNQTLLGNYAFPANHIIFVEDNLWIDGQINNARLTIASAKFPESPTTNTSITINNNLLYSNSDGQDTLALIAQKDINVGLNSSDHLTIDAALVAKNGRVGRFYYSWFCGSNYIRDTLTLFGMIATNQRYGFAFTDGTGYENRDINYDGNLLYAPPPYFPLSSDQYQMISWKEIKS
jgi:hypothetical protein